MFLPLLIFAVMMIYLAESRALMRCEKYIKDYIEPFQPELKKKIFDKEIEWKGWETWLEEEDFPNAFFIKNTKRSVDKLTAFFFYIFFAIHYIASAILSTDAFKTKFGDIGKHCAATAWIMIGIVFIAYFLAIFNKSTSTKV